jgi:capsular polysaccharide transport system permease protein
LTLVNFQFGEGATEMMSDTRDRRVFLCRDYRVLGDLSFFTPQAMPADWVSILLAILAIAIVGFGMGLCNAALEQLIPVWRFIWIPIARGQVLFSGVIYVPDFLPVHLRNVLAWNTVLQGVELFRYGFWPGYPNECNLPYYLWSFGFILFLIGLCADGVFRRRLDDI